MAKNQMKRSLRAILDPAPSQTDIARLWSFFDSSCAYCAQTLAREERLGHLDHILPHASGGTNDIHNHVLACGRCNGDEKREEDWRSFLAHKVSDENLRQERCSRIESWMQQAPPDRTVISPQTLQAADAIAARALQEFDAAVKEVRALRGSDL